MGNTCCVRHQRSDHKKSLLKARTDGKFVRNGGTDNPDFQDENEAYEWFIKHTQPGNEAELLKNAISIRKRDSSAVLLNAANLCLPTYDDNGQSDEKHVLLNEDRQNSSLGINIAGSLQKGIFVKKIVAGSVAEKSQLIFEGDRIASVTVFFEQISYQDALNILKISANYKVGLHLNKSPTTEFNEPHTSKTITPPDRQLETPMIPELFVNSESPSLLNNETILRRGSSMPTIYEPISNSNQPITFERTTSLPKSVTITYKTADSKADDENYVALPNSTEYSDEDDIIDFADPGNALSPQNTETHIDKNTSGSTESASIFYYRTPSAVSRVSDEIEFVESSSLPEELKININSPNTSTDKTHLVTNATDYIDAVDIDAEDNDTFGAIPDIALRERSSVFHSLRGTIDSYVPADVGDFVSEFEMEMNRLSPRQGENGLFFAKYNERFSDSEDDVVDEKESIPSKDPKENEHTFVEQHTKRRDDSENYKNENNSTSDNSDIEIGNLAAAILDGKSPTKQDTREQFVYSTPPSKGAMNGVERLSDSEENKVTIAGDIGNNVSSSNNPNINEEQDISVALSRYTSESVDVELPNSFSEEYDRNVVRTFKGNDKHCDDGTENKRHLATTTERVNVSLDRNTDEKPIVQHSKQKTGFGFHFPKLGRKNQSKDKSQAASDTDMVVVANSTVDIKTHESYGMSDLGQNPEETRDSVVTTTTTEITPTKLVSTSEGDVVVTLRPKNRDKSNTLTKRVSSLLRNSFGSGKRQSKVDINSDSSSDEVEQSDLKIDNEKITKKDEKKTNSLKFFKKKSKNIEVDIDETNTVDQSPGHADKKISEKAAHGTRDSSTHEIDIKTEDALHGAHELGMSVKHEEIEAKFDSLKISKSGSLGKALNVFKPKRQTRFTADMFESNEAPSSLPGTLRKSTGEFQALEAAMLSGSIDENLTPITNPEADEEQANENINNTALEDNTLVDENIHIEEIRLESSNSHNDNEIITEHVTVNSETVAESLHQLKSTDGSISIHSGYDPSPDIDKQSGNDIAHELALRAMESAVFELETENKNTEIRATSNTIFVHKSDVNSNDLKINKETSDGNITAVMTIANGSEPTEAVGSINPNVGTCAADGQNYASNGSSFSINGGKNANKSNSNTNNSNDCSSTSSNNGNNSNNNNNNNNNGKQTNADDDTPQDEKVEDNVKSKNIHARDSNVFNFNNNANGNEDINKEKNKTDPDHVLQDNISIDKKQSRSKDKRKKARFFNKRTTNGGAKMLQIPEGSTSSSTDEHPANSTKEEEKRHKTGFGKLFGKKKSKRPLSIGENEVSIQLNSADDISSSYEDAHHPNGNTLSPSVSDGIDSGSDQIKTSRPNSKKRKAPTPPTGSGLADPSITPEEESPPTNIHIHYRQRSCDLPDTGQHKNATKTYTPPVQKKISKKSAAPLPPVTDMNNAHSLPNLSSISSASDQSMFDMSASIHSNEDRSLSDSGSNLSQLSVDVKRLPLPTGAPPPKPKRQSSVDFSDDIVDLHSPDYADVPSTPLSDAFSDNESLLSEISRSLNSPDITTLDLPDKENTEKNTTPNDCYDADRESKPATASKITPTFLTKDAGEVTNTLCVQDTTSREKAHIKHGDESQINSTQETGEKIHIENDDKTQINSTQEIHTKIVSLSLESESEPGLQTFLRKGQAKNDAVKLKKSTEVKGLMQKLLTREDELEHLSDKRPGTDTSVHKIEKEAKLQEISPVLKIESKSTSRSSKSRLDRDMPPSKILCSLRSSSLEIDIDNSNTTPVKEREPVVSSTGSKLKKKLSASQLISLNGNETAHKTPPRRNRSRSVSFDDTAEIIPDTDCTISIESKTDNQFVSEPSTKEFSEISDIRNVARTHSSSIEIQETAKSSDKKVETKQNPEITTKTKKSNRPVSLYDKYATPPRLKKSISSGDEPTGFDVVSATTHKESKEELSELVSLSVVKSYAGIFGQSKTASTWQRATSSLVRYSMSRDDVKATKESPSSHLSLDHSPKLFETGLKPTDELAQVKLKPTNVLKTLIEADMATSETSSLTSPTSVNQDITVKHNYIIPEPKKTRVINDRPTQQGTKNTYVTRKEYETKEKETKTSTQPSWMDAVRAAKAARKDKEKEGRPQKAKWNDSDIPDFSSLINLRKSKVRSAYGIPDYQEQSPSMPTDSPSNTKSISDSNKDVVDVAGLLATRKKNRLSKYEDEVKTKLPEQNTQPTQDSVLKENPVPKDQNSADVSVLIETASNNNNDDHQESADDILDNDSTVCDNSTSLISESNQVKTRPTRSLTNGTMITTSESETIKEVKDELTNTEASSRKRSVSMGEDTPLFSLIKSRLNEINLSTDDERVEKLKKIRERTQLILAGFHSAKEKSKEKKISTDDSVIMKETFSNEHKQRRKTVQSVPTFDTLQLEKLTVDTHIDTASQDNINRNTNDDKPQRDVRLKEYITEKKSNRKKMLKSYAQQKMQSHHDSSENDTSDDDNSFVGRSLKSTTPQRTTSLNNTWENNSALKPNSLQRQSSPSDDSYRVADSRSSGYNSFSDIGSPTDKTNTLENEAGSSTLKRIKSMSHTELQHFVLKQQREMRAMQREIKKSSNERKSESQRPDTEGLSCQDTQPVESTSEDIAVPQQPQIPIMFIPPGMFMMPGIFQQPVAGMTPQQLPGMVPPSLMQQQLSSIVPQPQPTMVGLQQPQPTMVGLQQSQPTTIGLQQKASMMQQSAPAVPTQPPLGMMPHIVPGLMQQQLPGNLMQGVSSSISDPAMLPQLYQQQMMQYLLQSNPLYVSAANTTIGKQTIPNIHSTASSEQTVSDAISDEKYIEHV